MALVPERVLCQHGDNHAKNVRLEPRLSISAFVDSVSP